MVIMGLGSKQLCTHSYDLSCLLYFHCVDKWLKCFKNLWKHCLGKWHINPSIPSMQPILHDRKPTHWSWCQWVWHLCFIIHIFCPVHPGARRVVRQPHGGADPHLPVCSRCTEGAANRPQPDPVTAGVHRPLPDGAGVWAAAPQLRPDYCVIPGVLCPQGTDSGGEGRQEGHHTQPMLPRWVQFAVEFNPLHKISDTDKSRTMS